MSQVIVYQCPICGETKHRVVASDPRDLVVVCDDCQAEMTPGG